jgi:sporulation protein YlmC with PRC-barrel domain
MKKLLALMSIIAFLSVTAFSQETTPKQPHSKPPATEQLVQSVSSEYLFRVTRLLGRELQNPQGEPIGQVEDLIITTNDNVVQVIVSVGGFLGVGEKLVAISYEGLHIDPQKGIIVYDATQQELLEQPEFHYQEKEMEIPIRRIIKKDS